MTRRPDLALKARLLDGVVDHLADHGLPNFSLRPLAKALGVSTTSLVYHLGTREEILTSAFQRSSDLQTEIREAWLVEAPELTQTGLLRRWWDWMNDSPRNLALMRLGIEAAALEGTVSGLEADVRAAQIAQWRLNIEQRLISNGLAPERARIDATLIKATYTGLVLDLIATGDRERLTAALEEVLDYIDEEIARHLSAD